MFGWFRKTRVVRAIQVESDGSFSFDIVGEASYQSELKKIAGPKSVESKEHHCQALLICEDNNKHDRHAVCVVIQDNVVGYLPREVARDYRKWLIKIDTSMPIVAANAKIVGGWKDERSEGHYGVKLDFDLEPD